MTDGLSEYVVEIGVTGTWRERLLAGDEEEAQRWAETHLEEALTAHAETNWGDLGWEVTAVGEVDDGE